MVRKTTKKSKVDDETSSPAATSSPVAVTSTQVESEERVSKMDVSSESAAAVTEVPYNGLSGSGKRTYRTPTVKDIIVDPITQLASDHWATKPKVSLLFISIVVRFKNLSILHFFS
jgi:hypothetical protein